MREARVEDHLIKRVEETGGITRKVEWIGRRGAPDRLVGWPMGKLGAHALLMHGLRPVLVELKRPLTPKAEAHQLREHERLRIIGFDVQVLASKEDVDRFIEEMTS
jgi:hypothetical protein